MEDPPGIEPRAGRMLSGLASLRHVPICLPFKIPILRFRSWRGFVLRGLRVMLPSFGA